MSMSVIYDFYDYDYDYEYVMIMLVIYSYFIFYISYFQSLMSQRVSMSVTCCTS